MKQTKKEKAVTLIALVVTLIILLILVAVSINMLLGENGLITKAIQSGEQMQIASGKEEIDLQVLDIITGKVQQGESCTLEDIKEELPTRLDLSIVGEKGTPLEAIYVNYKNYEYEINDGFIVQYAGEGSYTERPTLILSLDQTQTGVEKVVITAEAEIIEGTIEEIEKPNGEKQQGNSTTYEVNQNGDYTFIATSDRGRITSKTISVTNIKEEGIDLTGLTTGENIEHNHIYEDKYDEQYHWQQCMICNNKINQQAHNKQMTEWALGSAYPHCRAGNYATEYCTACGYSKRITEQHPSLSNQFIKKDTTYNHMKTCTVCQSDVEEPCTKSDGSEIYCNNLGKCTICGYNYAVPEHNYYVNKDTQEIYCGNCNKVVGSCKYTIIRTNLNTITVQCDYEVNDGYSLGTTNNGYGYLKDDKLLSGTTGIEYTVSGTAKKTTAIYTIHLKSDYKSAMTLRPDVNIIGDNTTRLTRGAGLSLYYDNISPVITNIQETNNTEVSGWTTNKTITITGTEEFSDGVYITMEDSKGKKVIENAYAPVENQQYSYSFSAVLEADESGQDYKITVKDPAGNIVTSTKTVYKTDSQAPTLLSPIQYNEEWSRIKNIRFEAQDIGIGNVQIAFNTILDYAKAEQEESIYSREYTFIGDVYEDITGALYLQDGLGNVSTQKIIIGKMDNTSPTITNVRTEKTETGTTVIIEANDFNEKVGQEGSGIAGYSITTSKELPTERNYGTSNEIKVEKAGTYYIYVKDNTGNISARYTLEITE